MSLYSSVQSKKKQRRKYNEKYYGQNRAVHKNVRNSRNEWTKAELDAIVAPDKPSDRELSARLGRSMLAIQIMRSRIKKGGR